MTVRLAWKYRMEQEIDECRQVVAQLLSEAGIAPEDLLETWETSPSPHLTELCLLQASLFRSDGNIPLSQEWVKRIERRTTPTYALHFQKAANFFCLGKYGSALEDYLSAARLASRSEDKVIALVNAVFCLSNVGEFHETLLKEAKGILGKLPKTSLLSARSQLALVQWQSEFRKGNFEGVFAQPLGEEVDQRYHFRLWLAELPFHRRFHSLSSQERERYLTRNRALFRRSYRLRTIQGVWESEDNEWDQPVELTDRLYLWTWRWMCFPEQVSLDAVLSTVDTLRRGEGSARFTAEDQQMVRNSLSWLKLLLPAERGRLTEALQTRKKPSPDFPWFELEYAVIRYLAQPDEKLLRQIRRHPLWRKPQHELRGLLEFILEEKATPPGNIASFAGRLKEFLRVEMASGFTVADLRSLKVHSHQGDVQFSESLARGLALLAEERDAPFQTLLAAAFGIHRFQSVIHKTKILNLISRMRKCLPPEADIKTHAEVTHAIGDWRRVKVIAGFSSETGRVPEVRATTVSQPRLPLLLQLPKLEAFTREDLQRKFGTSRSSTTRLIRDWLEKGWVARTGNAKAISYQRIN